MPETCSADYPLDAVGIGDTFDIMIKTASVADLRNRFAAVSRWIYEGKSVAIEKRGKAFAVLSPARRRRAKHVALPDYEARIRRTFGGLTPRGATAEELVDRLRGEY